MGLDEAEVYAVEADEADRAAGEGRYATKAIRRKRQEEKAALDRLLAMMLILEVRKT